MSESIVIQENGVEKTVSIDKLKAKKAGGGTCDWVPEDGYQVGTLKVWRNGTFAASDFGVRGFDKVVVASGFRGGDAARLQGEKHVGETRAEALAIKEGGAAAALHGVRRVAVNKADSSRLHMMAESLLKLDDISIARTGTFKAGDYGAYGFDEVTVNIPESGGGSATKPDEIRVTRSPDKTEYAEGEAIDAAGMVVTAYRDGKVWTSDEYPRGVVPLREVTLDPTIARAAPEPSGDYVYSAWYEEIPRNDGVAQLFVIDGHMITVQYGKNQTNPNALVWVDGAFFNEIYTHRPFPPYGQGTPHFRYRQRVGASVYTLGIMSDFEPDNCYFYDLVEFPGDCPGGGADGAVAVNWQRPGDGRTLTANFDIEIIPQEEEEE